VFVKNCYKYSDIIPENPLGIREKEECRKTGEEK